MKASKMTLRDYFAGLAMQTILTDGLARQGIDGCDSSKVKVSELAYKIAKDMIDESESMKDQELDRQKIGEYWPEQGGIYFGRIEEDGELYALIVARQEDGEEAELSWQAANDFCRNLTIGGFDDWALPSRYDLLTMFRNNYGNAGGFSKNYYWSSTEFDYDTTCAHYCTQHFGYGLQSYDTKDEPTSVRAVRKVLI